jgi:hypothetical protein
LCKHVLEKHCLTFRSVFNNMSSTPPPGQPGLMSVAGLIASIQQNMTGATPIPADVEGVDWVYNSILGSIRQHWNSGRKSPVECLKRRKKVEKVRWEYRGGC